jgi:DNA-binding NarL/FixJ family response regulator
MMPGEKRPSGIHSPEIKISRREKEVLKLICEEYTTPEIADKLCISLNTVESHRSNLLTKLNVRNLAGLVRVAINNRLID